MKKINNRGRKGNNNSTTWSDQRDRVIMVSNRHSRVQKWVGRVLSEMIMIHANKVEWLVLERVLFRVV